MHCTRCSTQLLTLPDRPEYASISIRCNCGARYRIFWRGEHIIDKVGIDDLSEASVAAIDNDPSLTPADKVQSLESLAARATTAKETYHSGYGMLIGAANRAKRKWARQVPPNGHTLLWQIADTAKPTINNEPYDPANRTIDYAKLVAHTLNMEHLLT